MKKTFSVLFFLMIAAFPLCAESLSDATSYTFRFGYGIGGTAPVGMPATIRSLNSYELTPSFTFGLDMYKPMEGKWGVTTGLHIENKGMNIDATVKNYHMSIVRGGQQLEGAFTGRNATQVAQWMITLPVLATYSLADNVRLKLGPYISYVSSRKFKGYAYDGYLRVGNPTGPKVELGNDEGTRGTYDFSEAMRRTQYGVNLGADWTFHKSWGAYVDLSWGLTGIFHSTFDTIEQTLYPIYGTIGISHRIK